MRNELLLLGSVILYNGIVIILFKFFKKQGLYTWLVIATITANIEVLILIQAFGLEQTLGNVLFASTFLVTDILSELYSKKEAKQAVLVGTATSIIFIIFSQFMLQYIPSETDWAMPSMKAIFSNTPRVMLAGIAAYVISQLFDVWIYHKWWQFTETRSGSKQKFLWFRNNASTLISQLINTILFTWGAFWGMFPVPVLVSMTISTYIIYIFTSLLDTPFMYLARKIHGNQKLGE